jgi:hypothetical protein
VSAPATKEISDWLEKLDMSEYAQRFAENDIDIAVLRHLTDQDLKELGVSLGHRRKMLAAIAEVAGAELTSLQPVSTEPKPQDSAKRRQVTVMFSDLVGYTALSVRIHTVAERVRKTLTWISMSGKCLSLLRLHCLEEGEDGPQRLVVQHSLPVRHAFFSPAMRDREVEHVGRLLAVAALEPAQVSGRIRTNCVRRMAMRAILVEQAAPGSGPAGVVRTGRDGRIVGAHMRRCDRQTKQSGQ